MRFRYLAFLLVLTLAVPRASAEMRLTKRFSLDAAVRYRTIITNTDFDPNTGFNEFSAMRSQLGATFLASRDVTLRFKVKETRYLGTSASNSPSSADLSFQEVYVQLDNLLGSPLNLRFGRFEFAYGRNRIFGKGNWNNYGPRTYDAVRLELKTDASWWHLVYSKIEEGSFADPITPPLADPTAPANKGDRHLTVLTGSMWRGLVQPLFSLDLDERVPPPQTKGNIIFTSALTSVYKSGGFEFSGDAGYQLGTYNDRDLGSWLLTAELSYGSSNGIRPKFGAGVDVASGNKRFKDGANDVDHVFYTPFTSRHAYKGVMDYFRDERRGLIDSIVRFSFQPARRMGFEVTAHNFSYLENAKVTGYNAFSQLGQEVDSRMIAILARGFEFEAGYSFFLPTKEFAALNGFTDKAMGQFIYITLQGKL